MTDWKAAACEAIDRSESMLRGVSRELHEHPEVKHEEVRAAGLLARHLRDAGFEVEVGVGGLPTGLLAVHPATSEGPTVAILAEYDALPEIGHACGHNLIAGAALGAAIGVASVKGELPGRLLLLGTPAEEGGGGKVTMVDAGLFREVDAAMMVHPSSFTVTGWGSLAITEVKIEFRGRPAHASAWPEKGINALDAAIQTFNGLNAMRQHIKDGARIHGIITHGGVKPNIVPEYSACEFYVRAPETAYRDELLRKLRSCAEGAATATGATMTFSLVGHAYKAMKPNRAFGKAFEKNLESLGWSFAPPADNVMGSTDMGDVSQAVPSIHPYVAIADEGTAAHTREFAEAAASERGQAAMLDAAKGMAMTAIDIMTSPSLLAEMRREFSGG